MQLADHRSMGQRSSQQYLSVAIIAPKSAAFAIRFSASLSLRNLPTAPSPRLSIPQRRSKKSGSRFTLSIRAFGAVNCGVRKL
ncbi:MAG: hypothetical protein WBX14_04930, partial [Candidatus Udaeobacter sp.]